MKRLVLEFPYQGFWKTIFGRNSETLEVVEAMKSFKCDREGFAVICRIRFLDNKTTTRELLSGGAIEEVETLYREGDGSEVIFVAGDFPKTAGARGPPPAKVFSAGPPEFIDVNRMKATVVGEENEIRKLLEHVGKSMMAPKILSLTRLEPKSESPVSRLTAKQRQTLLTAYGSGYYEVPRRATSKELARLLRIDKSTFAEHLRKAERNVVKSVLEG